MRTPGPTTRSTHAAFHFGEGLIDTNISGLGSLAGNNPTNPLIASEWRNILPNFDGGRSFNQSFFQVSWHFVDCAT